MSKKRIGIIVGSLISVVFLLVAVERTFAWFFNNQTVQVDGSDAGVVVDAGKLEIGVLNEDGEIVWGTAVKLNETELTYSIDITGDGVHFWYPKTLDGQDQPITTSKDAFLDVNPSNAEGYYVTFDLYLRSSAQTDVYLSNMSYVLGSENRLSGADEYARKSRVGDFSCDGIAGAVRVSVQDVTDTYHPTLKCVWVPNDTFELTYTDSEKTEAVFTTDGQSEAGTSGYRYMQKGASKIETVTYTAEAYADGTVAVGSSGLATATDIQHAVSLTSFNTQGISQQRVLRVSIWIEGTDREADKAFNGGILKYRLSLVSIKKSDLPYTLGTNASATVRTVKWSGEKNAFVYSVNGGEDTEWNAGELEYTEDGIHWADADTLTQSAEKTVYLRVKETKSAKPSNVVRVTIPAV